MLLTMPTRPTIQVRVPLFLLGALLALLYLALSFLLLSCPYARLLARLQKLLLLLFLELVGVQLHSQYEIR